MKLAIEEAEKCLSEDDEIHPMVGVVIVKDGGVLVSAHRNENQKGSHAEFMAFKKAREASLDVRGATLYTTLEPCTYRNKPDFFPCSEHIANESISEVVIGMLDANPRIRGNGVNYLRKNRVAVNAIGILEEEILGLNSDYVKKYQQQ